MRAICSPLTSPGLKPLHLARESTTAALMRSYIAAVLRRRDAERVALQLAKLSHRRKEAGEGRGGLASRLVGGVKRPGRTATDVATGVMAERRPRLTDEDITRAFNLYDKNGNGVISKSELKAILRYLGDDKSDDELGRLMAEVRRRLNRSSRVR